MKKGETGTENVGEGKKLLQHKHGCEVSGQNVELCEDIVLNAKNFVGTGLVPITHAEISPTHIDKAHRKILNQKFNEAGYQWPIMKKTNAYMRKRNRKALAHGLLAFTSTVVSVCLSFILLASFETPNDDQILVWFLTFAIAAVGGTAWTNLAFPSSLTIPPVPPPDHWDSATLLWGVLKNKKTQLPSGLKSLAEEQLKYAISAAETMDWVQKYNVSEEHPQRIAAEEELRKSKKITELIIHVAAGAEQARPANLNVENDKVFKQEISEMETILSEWEKSLTQNINIVSSEIPAELGQVDLRKIVNKLREAKNDLGGDGFSLPSELKNFVLKYLSQAELALATLEWAGKYPVKTDDPQVADARMVKQQAGEVYHLVVRAENISRLFSESVDAEKARPRQAFTNTNVDVLKEMREVRSETLSEWEKVYYR